MPARVNQQSWRFVLLDVNGILEDGCLQRFSSPEWGWSASRLLLFFDQIIFVYCRSLGELVIFIEFATGVSERVQTFNVAGRQR